MQQQGLFFDPIKVERISYRQRYRGKVFSRIGRSVFRYFEQNTEKMNFLFVSLSMLFKIAIVFGTDFIL